MLKIIGLFSVPALVWGSTWYVITLQYGDVHPFVSVFWRFIFATVIMFFICLAAKKNMKFNVAAHLRFILLGIFLFSGNYLCFYYTEQFISSGIVALIFSLLPSLNALGSKLFLKNKVEMKTVLACVLGLSGVSVIYMNEVGNTPTKFEDLIVPYLLTLLGVVLASVGNLVSQQNGKINIPLMPSMAYGMLYGSLVALAVSLIAGGELKFSLSGNFLFAHFYLVVFGTVFAFITYLKLINLIGSDKAGYALVSSTAVAVIISMVVENLQPDFSLIAGLILCLMGQVLVLTRKNAPVPVKTN